MKVCTKCGDEKPLEEFPTNTASPDGLRGDCKLCRKEKKQAYYKKNRKQVKLKAKKYREKNKEKINAYYNSEKTKQRIKNYYQENKADFLARKAKRRAAKLERTPAWADLEKIKEIYKKRPSGYHVDHIVPLQGENVSGLHVPWNLQYLPAEENLRKSNKFDGTI